MGDNFGIVQHRTKFILFIFWKIEYSTNFKNRKSEKVKHLQNKILTEKSIKAKSFGYLVMVHNS